MQPLPHQIEFSTKAFSILKEKGYVYIAGKPRSGKTLTSILTAENSKIIKNVLVLCPRNAIPGWKIFTTDKELNLQHNYYITNYEQGHKIDPDNYDLVIIDESHNLGVLGRPTQRVKVMRHLCAELPHIHLSGTAIVESPNGIYHQMAVSKYTPFKHKNFYDFFREFGLPYYIQAGGREITMYDKADLDKLMPLIDEFTLYMTQEDAGISKDLQAVDKLHYITLHDDTIKLYNNLQDMQYIEHDNLPEPLVCDSEMKLRTSLHMLESGIAKIGENYYELGNTEKIDYIIKTFGDTNDTGVMCHFVGERQLLKKKFKNIEIYSSTSHAEGVDLSHLKNFVILSSDYKGAKFIQRRERIINIKRSNTLTVHHILVKKAISEQVYKKVSKKEDFNNSTYERDRL